MADEHLTATTVIEATVDAVFVVLSDPARHASIDGTGWVCEAVDRDPLTAAGQVFRMGMYHPNHPDGNYRTANEVLILDRPTAIAWRTGWDPGDGVLQFGGWFWRYDLAATAPTRTTVTLTYDWSALGPEVREYLSFPPFAPDHLSNSLAHLAELVARPPA